MRNSRPRFSKRGYEIICLCRKTELAFAQFAANLCDSRPEKLPREKIIF